MSDVVKPKVLIVDDDTRILKLLNIFFNQNGFESVSAIDAIEAEQMVLENEFDLIILDVMLPKVTGYDFAQKIKSKISSMPIIMLTALSEPDHRVKGLEIGADDYITKPFDPRELLLRAKNLIELYKNSNPLLSKIIFGKNSYDLYSKEFKSDEKIVQLTSTEKKLLDYMVSNRGEVCTREELSKTMGGLSDRSIDVQIVRLRQKIEDDPKNPKFLQTIRHEGYALYV